MLAVVSWLQVISALRPRSVVIRFLGGVSGIVRGSELKAKFGALWDTDPTSCYREGQVVMCTVLSCEASSKRLLLSLLSTEEAASRPAAALLQRSAKKGQGAEGAAQPAGKKRTPPAVDPTDDELASVAKVEDVTVGAHTVATVVALGDNGLLVCRLGHKGALRGRIHMSELADAGTDAHLYTEVPKHPLKVVVVESKAAAPGKTAAPPLELSARPSDVNTPRGTTPGVRPTISGLDIGQVCQGWVRDVNPDGVWVSLSYSVTGRVIPLEASEDPNVSVPCTSPHTLQLSRPRTVPHAGARLISFTSPALLPTISHARCGARLAHLHCTGDVSSGRALFSWAGGHRLRPRRPERCAPPSS